MSRFVRSAIAPLLGLLVALFAQASFAEDWIVVAPGDGKYVIQMPGKPEEGTQQISGPSGPLPLHTYQVAVGNEEYVSTYIEYPVNILAAGEQAQTRLKSAIQSFKNSYPNSTIRVENETNVGDHPGRVFILDLSNGTSYTACMYIVGKRLYQNIASTPKERAGGPNAVKFLESFTVYKE